MRGEGQGISAESSNLRTCGGNQFGTQQVVKRERRTDSQTGKSWIGSSRWVVASGKYVDIALGNPVSASPHPLRFVKRELIQKKLTRSPRCLTDVKDADGAGRRYGRLVKTAS